MEHSRFYQVSGYVLLVLGVLFYLFVFPHGIHGDAYFRYDNLLHFLRTGELREMNFSYVGPFLSSPLLLLGNFAKDSYWWMSRFNTFLFLGAAFFYWKQVRTQSKEISALPFLLLLFCATMFPKHITDYYSEILTVSSTVIALFLILSGQQTWLPILLIAIGVWNTPGTAMAGMLIFAALLVRQKQLRFLVGPPLIVIGMVLENLAKYGEWFPNPYIANFGAKNLLPYSGGPGFSYPIFFGVLSVFFSFGKGLLFFTPGLIYFPRFAKFRGSLLESLIFMGVVYLVGLLLIFPRWWCWTGDYFWGPRYYLSVSLFAAFALAMRLRQGFQGIGDRLLWLGCTALSLWVGCQGIVFGQAFLEDCYKQGNDLEFICYYVPEYSVLWRPFIVWPTVKGRALAYLIFFALVSLWVLSPTVLQLWAELKKKAIECWNKEVWYSSWKI